MTNPATIDTAPAKKPPDSNPVHQKVLELRRRHSLRQVAELAGLPIGTVKTICSRSGAFRDNQAHRTLFSLPPMQVSESTALAVPTLPPQDALTGDKELDAVLWLREVIKSGRAELIAKAMEAAKRIKTPLKELEARYLKHLVSRNPGNWTVAFQTFGFADLEGLASTSVRKLSNQDEAVSRFGSVEGIGADTPAEQFCIDTLAGLSRKGTFGEYVIAQVDARFKACPDLLPNTLSDCLHELVYWRDLYTLRQSHDYGDPGPQASAREDFAFRCLAHIRPRTKPEAVAVLRYLATSENMERNETDAILLNLVGGWPAATASLRSLAGANSPLQGLVNLDGQK